MQSVVHRYNTIIKEGHLDTFGHMNNATYLALLEEARWEMVTERGFGLKKIMAEKIGPTILDISIRFLKELNLRDEITIESEVTSYEKKICIIEHRILRGTDICSTATFTLALFDLNQRKIILPTEEWLHAIGVSNN